MPPPMKPWMARQTIISLMVEQKAHIIDAMVKPPAAMTNIQRVEIMRDR